MAAGNPDQQISIYEFAENCEALFDQLLTMLSTAGEDHYQTAQQLRSSFERWAGFLGVFAAQHVSLDRRLESSPQIRDRFFRLLKVVKRNAEHALGFESARRQILQREDAIPPSKAEAGRKVDAISVPISPGTKAALQGIQEALEGLHRISVALRKTSKSSLTFRVERFTQKAKCEFDFYERMDLLIVKGLYPSIPPSLAKQLAETVSFRRARLQFQRSRKKTLETRRARPTEHTKETQQSHEPTEHFRDKAQRSVTRSATSTTHSATDVTSVNYQLFQQNLTTEESPVNAPGSAGPSTVSGIEYGNSYPPLPNNAQCNWCFHEHNISRDKDGWKQAWKDHFKRDIEPYVCISDECSSNLQYFVSLRDWRHHMISQHTVNWIEEVHRPATWFCETGDHDYLDFATEAELRNHLEAAHSDRFNSEQRDTVVERNVVYTSRGYDTCPLCGTDVARLLENAPSPDPPSPTIKPQPLAKPSSSKKPAKRLRFDTSADPVNSDEDDYHEASDWRIDTSEAGEPTAEDVQWRTNQIRLSSHVAGHLKSLAFTSLRYFDGGNDDSASQESKRVALGDAGEKLSSEGEYGDHYFELDELNETSFQEIPRDQRNDEVEAPPPDATTTAVWAAIRTQKETFFAPVHVQDQESTSADPAFQNNPFNFSTEPQQSLSTKITEAVVTSPFQPRYNHAFAPGWALSYITKDSIIRHFSQNPHIGLGTSHPLDEPLLQYILQNHIKELFGICIASGIPKDETIRLMRRCMDHGITENIIIQTDEKIKATFATCNQFWTDRFVRSRYLFRAPVLSHARRHKTILLHNYTSLPIVSAGIPPKIGGFAKVHEVIIHTSFLDQNDPIREGGCKAAIKELSDGPDGWQREATALETIGTRYNLLHLVDVKAMIMQASTFYLVFPWANGGNLMDFWERYDSYSHRHDIARDFIGKIVEQILGLSNVLQCLHNFGSSGEVSYHHGNLKPENILVFQPPGSPSHIPGIWKIADLGLANLHEQVTGARYSMKATSKRGWGTTSYKPPESFSDPRSPTSRLFDIWSMGCILLQLITWLVYGMQRLKDLAENTKIQDNPSCFWEGTWNRRHGWTDTEVHGSVLELIEELRRDLGELSGEWNALLELLTIVRQHLLIIPERGPQSRMDARGLYIAVQEIHQKCQRYVPYRSLAGKVK